MSTSIRVLVVSAALTFASLHAAQAAESPAIHPAIQAAVDSQERLPKDRARDDNRHYAEIMEFFGVRPGMTVIELFAAGGNTAEVLARAVGPNGKVYMQNPDFFYERFGRKGVDERLANDRLPNVVRLDKPLNELGLAANSLDGAVAAAFATSAPSPSIHQRGRGCDREQRQHARDHRPRSSPGAGGRFRLVVVVPDRLGTTSQRCAARCASSRSSISNSRVTASSYTAWSVAKPAL